MLSSQPTSESDPRSDPVPMGMIRVGVRNQNPSFNVHDPSQFLAHLDDFNLTQPSVFNMKRNGNVNKRAGHFRSKIS